MSRSRPHTRDPLADRPGPPPVRSFTVPDALASRLRDRATFMDTTPRALCTALLRHYIDHPELYGVQWDGQGRPTLHAQGLLFDQLTEGAA